MPGNEKSVVEFLFNNLLKISLDHIGIVEKLSNPGPNGTRVPLQSMDEIRPDSSKKKADIYINDLGVSIKQSGGSFPFNRILRSNLQDLLKNSFVENEDSALLKIDKLVTQFHTGGLKGRNVPWNDVFEYEDFKKILRHLMLIGSPTTISDHPAEYILTAPAKISDQKEIKVQSFEEYLRENLTSLYISIRRSWVGQISKSENARALSISRNPANGPWVFESIAGYPRTGWRTEVPENERRTVYFLMIEKT